MDVANAMETQIAIRIPKVKLADLSLFSTPRRDGPSDRLNLRVSKVRERTWIVRMNVA